ncbi:MAG: leucine-rich repeat domain-containing protein [Eubacteriales bacterium]
MEVFQDFEYEILTVMGEKEGDSKRKIISLEKYLGNEKNVVIPDEIEGYPVTVMNGTFAGKEELERVTLPKKLETLVIATFQDCIKLKTIHFPSSLKKIGINAFMNCTSLEEITVSDSAALIEKMSLDLDVFEDCPKLCDENGFIILKTLLLSYQGTESQVTIPDGITKISEAAFYDNRIVTSVVVPDSVTIVGKQAFYQCVNLTEITLSKELKTIGQEAFFDCKKLEQISLPEQVKEIEKGVFSDCVSLKEIQWSENLEFILDDAFSGCYSLEEISFPENLNCIKKSFVGCINLQKITIPPSVNSIYKKAFEKCNSLEIIEILDRPEGTEKLDLQISCFPYSAKMRENVLKKGQEVPDIIAKTFNKAHTQKYLTDLFASWDKLSETAKDLFRQEWKKKITVKVKKGKNRLRNLMFLESTAKEMGIYFKEGFHLELPELEEYLEFSIKNENTAETALLLDYKNKTYSKDYLEELETRKNLVDIGLELPTLKELREKWTVTTRKDHIIINGYHGKSKVEILPPTLADGTPIRKIKKTYDGFKTLEKLTLPAGIEEIGESAFNETSLEVIHIPSTVTYIGTQAFSDTKITEITLPSSLDYVNNGMFWGCAKLEKVILPDTITKISKSAFNHCVSLADIHIPESVKKIEAAAFYRCHKLKNITLPDSVEIMERDVFEECYSLEEIRLPSGLLELKDNCFAHCRKLKKVILPVENMKIGDNVWWDCPSLEFIGVEGGENLLHKYKKE